MAYTEEMGAACERVAEAYYLNQGFELVKRNFRVTRGEIDLILKRENQLLFVEVKGRTNDWEPAAHEFAWRGKRRRLRAAMRIFLAQNPEFFETIDEFYWEIVFVSRGRVAGRYRD
jgi:putative endonuclease